MTRHGKVTGYSEDKKLNSGGLKWIFNSDKLSKWSQLENILSYNAPKSRDASKQNVFYLQSKYGKILIGLDNFMENIDDESKFTLELITYLIKYF